MQPKRKDNWKQLGKYFYQLSVYSYAGAFLTAMVNIGNCNPDLTTVGAMATIGFAVLGFMFNYISNEKE